MILSIEDYILFIFAGSRREGGSAFDSRARGPRFDSRSGH